MSTRKQFIQQGGLGLFSLSFDETAFIQTINNDFKGIVLNEDEGEVYQYPDRVTGAPTRILKIKLSKTAGSHSMSFLSESFMPGDAIQIHKHSNEDELIFVHKGTGIFTLDEKEYNVSTGAVAYVPRGVWHGLKNTGTEYVEMRFAYTPAGLEQYFREIGTPKGQPFRKITPEERKTIGLRYGLIRKE
jgi:quercetin dioxygenase-like cupin family protein